MRTANAFFCGNFLQTTLNHPVKMFQASHRQDCCIRIRPERERLWHGHHVGRCTFRLNIPQVIPLATCTNGYCHICEHATYSVPTL